MQSLFIAAPNCREIRGDKVIKITSIKDLKCIEKEKILYDYISTLIEYLLENYSCYCPDCSIESIGTIYCVEKTEDFYDYEKLGLNCPVNTEVIEWVMEFDNYNNICIVTDTDFAINIICKKDIFEAYIKER